MQSTRPCVFPECGKPVNAKDLCQGHYLQQKKGKPLRPLHERRDYEAANVESFWTRVEKLGPNDCWMWTGPRSGTYGTHGSSWAHRRMIELTAGPIPGGMQVDHQCRNRLCVNPAHLKVVTSKQNAENLSRTSPKGTSSTGARGVSFCKRTGLYAAKATHNYKTYWAGRHETLAQASAAATALRNKLFSNNRSDHGF